MRSPIIILLFSLLSSATGVIAQVTNQHDQNPKQATKDELDTEAMIKKIKESDYYKNLQELEKFVTGKKVLSSKTGNSGFILYLSDNSWAAAYRLEKSIGSSFGKGSPTEQIEKLISSEKYGDAREPIQDDVIYAKEYVNIEDEIKKSHGNTIKGLSFGFNTFNYDFESGRELDFKLVNDKNGIPSIRVFWEQW